MGDKEMTYPFPDYIRHRLGRGNEPLPEPLVTAADLIM